MARNAQIVGQVVDIHSQPWDVREYRPTAHGFAIALGWPQGEPRGRGGRGPAVVPTAALIAYLGSVRLRDLDLPISRGPAKRLRREFGIQWDWNAWWAEREADLRVLTLEAFAKKHGCSTGAASQRRNDP